MQFSRTLTGSLLLAALFSTAHAQEAPPPADVRCLMVGMRMSTFTDPEQRTGGNMLTFYYFGRLEKFSAKAIEDAIIREAAAVTPSDFQADASRCGKTLMDKRDALTQIGGDLAKRAQDSPNAAPAAPAPPAQNPSGKQ
jgi:hypothetical protein